MSSVTINNDDVIQDPATKKRMSTKYPGCVALDWEEAERIVREAEGGRNKSRSAYVQKGKSALERRIQSIGDYKRPRKTGWIHTVKPSKTHRAADWGVALGASALFAIALYFLFFLGVPIAR
jgi:hypothetical protein